MHEVSELDLSSVEYAGKVQLKKFGAFLQTLPSKFVNLFADSSYGDFPHIDVSWFDEQSKPVFLQYAPQESHSLLELIQTENDIFNKVIIVLASLLEEVRELVSEAETKYFFPLLLYGEGFDTADGCAQVMMARFLPLLQELSCFVDRAYDVVRNIVHQLASVFSPQMTQLINLENVHFVTLFEALGNLLKVFMVFDEIISRQTILAEHWRIYIKTIKMVHHNPDKFDSTRVQLKPLETVLQNLDEKLMAGHILEKCLTQQLDAGHLSVTRNQRLNAEFVWIVKHIYSRIEKLLGEPGETTERQRLASLCTLHVFYISVFRNIDKKAFKQVFDTYKKVPVMHLIGDIFWSPTGFLLSKLPDVEKALDRKALQAFNSGRINYLNNRIQAFPRDCQACIVQMSDWLLRFHSLPDWGSNINKDLEKREKLYTQGLRFAYSVSHLLKTYTGLHVSQKRPMTKDSVNLVLVLVQLLKALQATFLCSWSVVAESSGHIIQHNQSNLLRLLSTCKSRVETESRKLSERRLDILAGIVLAQTALSGTSSSKRLSILNLSIEVASQSRTFQPDELNAINNTLKKIGNIQEMAKKLSEACNCDFIYWQRKLLTAYFDNLMQKPDSADNIRYMFSALMDCFPMLSAVRHLEQGDDRAVTRFEDDIMELLNKELLDKVCIGIETDLRLSIHTHLQLDDRSPFSVTSPSFEAFIRLPPLRLRNRYINIRGYVEQYLEKTFYNLTTVALHDWRTYAEMRQLAERKYGLLLTDSHLPNQQLEQGLDVLEIMRNIHQFVTNYMYNLNNQIFIERTSNNKHLNTISIKHIANSIRTHGSGIMNTTVNFTYQFLRTKFYIFSQFLYDEQIKSRLIKAIRYFKTKAEDLNKMYPFDKADKFNRGIRKLGLNRDGLTYLDQFRILISQIGNAMGYVRMIRSGGLQCVAQSVRFIPDLDDILNFGELCSETGLSTETVSAGQRLDDVIGGVTRNLFDGSNYFKMLVDVFADEFKAEKNLHLTNFYIIIPPLTINYIEYIMSAKDKIIKKGGTGATFTDDGFAMGIAYILQLLDQHRAFDSLHWFESVRSKFRAEKQQLREQAKEAATSRDEKLQQTMSLTAKRLEQHRREFELLYFSLSSARIFFRRDLDEEIKSLSEYPEKFGGSSKTITSEDSASIKSS